MSLNAVWGLLSKFHWSQSDSFAVKSVSIATNKKKKIDI